MIRFFILFSVAAFGNSPLATCDHADDQIQNAKKQMSDDQRLGLLQKIFEEVASLEALTSLPEGMPAKVVERCKLVKSQAIDQIVKLSSDSLKSRTEFNLVLARLKLLQNKQELAFQYYQKAVEGRPNDYSNRLEALRVLLGWQSSLISSEENVTLKADKKSKFLQKSRRLLKEITESSAPTPAKSMVCAVHAEALESLGFQQEALTDWRNLLEFEPRHLKALERLSDHEIKVGNHVGALKLLQALAPMAPQNLKVQRSYLKELEGESNWPHVSAYARKIMKEFPSDPEIKYYLARALTERKELVEAQSLVNEILTIEPQHEGARRLSLKLQKSAGKN